MSAHRYTIRSLQSCAKNCNNKRFPENISDRQSGGHIFLAFFGNAALNAIITIYCYYIKGECFLKKSYTMEIVG